MIYNDREVASPVQNVFGEWVYPERYSPPPCIHIPVTEDMRARDAARQPIQTDWKIKATLCEANLGVVRPAPRPQKIITSPRAPKSNRLKPARRRCSCGRPLLRRNERVTCSRCWRQPGNPDRLAKRVPCDSGCGRLLRAGRVGGLCAECHWKHTMPAVKRRWRAKKRAKRSEHPKGPDTGGKQ